MGLVRVVPLGGAGEIGKNCTVVEQGDDIVVVDLGLSFPHEEHYGVDVVIPDVSYLVENQARVRGVFLTHAHEDHVGALSYVLPKLDVPVYCTAFTEALVRTKLEERANLKDPNIMRVKPGDKVEAGSMTVEFVRVTHSIPETCALAIKTEHGHVLFTADFKLDFTPVDGRKTDMARLTELGREGVVALFSDSTNVDRPGWGTSESRVTDGFRKVFSEAPGRVLVTMFASNIHRMQQAFDVAKETGRRVAVTGRRMETTIDVCRKLGYLDVPEGTYLRLDDVPKHRASELVILTTGSQGEPMAALSQMSRGEYNRLKVQPGDTVLYSARPIPGNEAGIWRTVNRLFRLGAIVVTDSDSPIHVSGHAYQEELKAMISLTQPYYLAPVHGEPRHQFIYAQMAAGMGYPESRIFALANGDALHMDDTQAWIEEGAVVAGEVLIDQANHLPVSGQVISERTSMGHDGLIVVTVRLDAKAGAVEGRPTAVAKGFIGPAGAIEDALDDACTALAKLRAEEARDAEHVARVVEDSVRRSLQRRAQQKPLVLATVVP
jgi:ribonuclease J